jgi:hypothetical protein
VLELICLFPCLNIAMPLEDHCFFEKSMSLQVTLWYGSIYLVFMFIYFGASSEWVYWVLDWDRPSALAMYALLPLLLFAAHVVW